MIGTTLQNRYRIESELGHGGMGTVYRAHDLLLERAVAVKVVSNATLGAEGHARLLREARAVAKLNHPNILTVYDAGEVDRLSFIVMELIEGKTLREHRPQSIHETIDIAQHTCAALEHAHAQGIIHRDLKPENVMIAQQQTVKLMDFGLAFSTGATRLTQEDVLVGTMAYLAPELIEGQPASVASDLYALGVLCYELLTGRLPFGGDNLAAVLMQHLQTLPAPPSIRNPEVSPALDLLIMRLLAKKPEHRPASAREVRHILEKISAGDAVAQPDVEAPRTNLPAQLTSFIGRQEEIREVKRLLNKHRLVTLVGPGGTGKTRLCLETAACLLDDFPDGVWFVDLAPLTDPELVPKTMATAVGLREEAGRSSDEALREALHAQVCLLILDNCEHLITACAQLTETLLRACAQLRIVTTSREALSITGEVLFHVPSLAAPDPQHMPSRETLAQYDAVHLLVERAALVRPDFEITDDNAPAIAQLCARLDGIPLALELAAARLKVLRVEQIAARLDDRFQLLTGGSRNALPRQQTLRALIDWSYSLLSAPERALFRRLAVFFGGWTLAAAEAVCADEGIKTGAVLDLLTQLVNKSLVVVEHAQGTEARYRLLETIRQYALEKWQEADETAQVRDRHLDFFRQMADRAEPELQRGQQSYWLDRLGEELDNLRAALDWATTGGGSVEAGMQLAAALWRFWHRRGQPGEGRDHLARLLNHPAQAAQLPTSARARALGAAGSLAYYQDDYLHAAAFKHAALDIFRQQHNESGMADALISLGNVALSQGDHAAARARYEEGLEIRRRLGDSWGIARLLSNFGLLTYDQGDYARAHALQLESLGLFQEMDDQAGIAYTLNALGDIARRQGDLPAAHAYHTESMNINRALGDEWGLAYVLDSLADVAVAQGQLAAARALYREALELFRQRGDKGGTAYCLESVAAIALATGQPAKGAQLLGAVERLRASINFWLPPADRVEHERYVTAARAQLDADALAAAWAVGRTLSLKQAIELALSEV